MRRSSHRYPRDRGGAVVSVLVLLAMALLVAAGVRYFGTQASDKLRCHGEAVAAIGAGGGATDCDAPAVARLAGGPPAAQIEPPPSPAPVTAATGTAEVGTWVVPFGAHAAKDKKEDPALTRVDKPNPRFPDPWDQPPPTNWDGKCGVTGCSNLLRFYGVELDPRDLDTNGIRDWTPGMRIGTSVRNLNAESNETFRGETIRGSAGHALETLRGYLDEGRPVAVLYMTDVWTAHWVVVTNVGDGDDPDLTVQSWGDWYSVKWSDFAYQWKRAYGGPYPHVVADDSSPVMRQAVVGALFEEVLGRKGTEEEVAGYANSGFSLSDVRTQLGRGIADAREAEFIAGRGEDFYQKHGAKPGSCTGCHGNAWRFPTARPARATARGVPDARMREIFRHANSCTSDRRNCPGPIGEEARRLLGNRADDWNRGSPSAGRALTEAELRALIQTFRDRAAGDR